MFRRKLFLLGKSVVDAVFFPCHMTGGVLIRSASTLLGWPVAGGITLDHLVKVPAARFLHCKANVGMFR